VPSVSVDHARLRRWRLALLAAYVLGGLLSATWGPRLPALTSDLHVSTAAVGAVLATATAGLLVGLLAAAPVARRLGIRRTVAAALVVNALGMAVAGLGVAAGSATTVVIALLVVGFGSGVLDVAVNVDGAAVEERTGRSFLPLLHALWLVGAAIGAGIGAACAALGIAIAGQAVGEAVLIVAVGLVIVAWVPGGRRGEPEEAAEDQPIAARFRQWLHGWTDRRLLLIGLLIFAVEVVEGSARTWLPLAVQRGYEQPAATAALFVTGFSISTAVLRAFGGPIVDRFGRVAVVRVTTAIGLAGVLLFLFGGSLWTAMAGALLWSVGNCLAGPLGMSAAAEGGGDAAARVGVVSSIGFFAGLAAPPLIGLIVQGVGPIAAFWPLVPLLVVAFVIAPALRRRAMAPAEARR
jgi:MFS family permease